MNKIKEALEKAKKAEFYNQRILLIDQALAALEKDGYVLVPVEPSEKMLKAGLSEINCIKDRAKSDLLMKWAYGAMIKAAQEG